MLFFHVLCAAVALAIATLLHLIVPDRIDSYPLWVILGAIAFSNLLTWLAGHAPRGAASRPAQGQGSTPSQGTPNSAAWYIESSAVGSELPHSCSFVEFDERGDYLDFEQ